MVGSDANRTTVFRDGTTQWHVSFPPGEDATRDVAIHDDVSLASFFERPIYQANYVWDPASASPFFQALDPWTAFFSNPRVSNRVSNFALLKCRLRVKFMISGNGFYYGRLLAHYDPLATYNTVSGYASGATTRTCIQASQGLHAFIDPTESQGCEFTLPFIYPYDAVDLTTTDLSTLGSMYVRQLQPLKHANGDINPVSISVFIWAEDVKLSIPTTQNSNGITAQGGDYGVTTQGDEYGMGPVSMVASSIAAAAGRLSRLPVIGRYMRATEMAGGAMSQIARLFGYSRPVVIVPSITMKPDLISKLAVTDVGDHSSKLTVDSKQEVSIDPHIVGLGAPDELVISHIASQSSYLTQFPWTTTVGQGTLLWETRVTPITYDYSAGVWNLTACAFAALPFSYWRGTMRYRFQIVASAFHKGRLAITWDPKIMSGTVVPNLLYTRVVDLANERDFTIDVCWGNPRHFCATTGLSTTVPYVTALHYATTLATTTNGVLSVTVLNDLTSPTSTVNNDIAINVYVGMCPDAEFAAPNNSIANFTFAPTNGIQTQGGTFDHNIVAQAGEYGDAPTSEPNDPGTCMAAETLGECMSTSDPTDAVYFGERVSSFRQLLKRFSYWGVLASPGTTAGTWQYSLGDAPPARGFYVNGMFTNGTNNVNYCNTTMLTYLSPAFLATRGGYRRKYVLTSPAANLQSYMAVDRLPSGISNFTASNAFVADVVTTPAARAIARVNSRPEGMSGKAITSITQMPVLEVELPFYSNSRFDNPRQPSGRAAVGGLQVRGHMLSVDQLSGTPYVDVYVAAAEDFTLIGFQGCPPLLSLSTLV